MIKEIHVYGRNLTNASYGSCLAMIDKEMSSSLTAEYKSLYSMFRLQVRVGWTGKVMNSVLRRWSIVSGWNGSVGVCPYGSQAHIILNLLT